MGLPDFFRRGSCRRSSVFFSFFTYVAFVLLVLLVPRQGALPRSGNTRSTLGVAAATQISLSVLTLNFIQVPASTGATRTLTFLSSGYQSETAFLADVATCMAALTNSTGGVASDPWPRYISLFNVYALYKPSTDVGASRPKTHGDDCTYMSDCRARTVDNNLDCAFGTPNPQVLSCRVSFVQTMAQFSPAQDIVVVIVNDAEPSGAGADSMVFITNEPSFMPYMLVHYLNRAVAGLQEEYDLGIPGTGDKETSSPANCALPTSGMKELWSYWKNYCDAGLSLDGGSDTTSSDAAADSYPVGSGCSLSAYAAPTVDGCLMRNSSVSHMCPICKERLTLALFSEGVASSLLLNPSSAALNLTAGRCPPEDYTSYVSPSSSAASAGAASASSSSSFSLSAAAAQASTTLYLSLGSFAFQSDLEIVWSDAQGRVLANNTPTLVIDKAAEALVLPTVITATIRDVTPNVRPVWREEKRAAMTSTTTFAVAAWTSSVSCETASVPSCFSSRSTFATPPSGVCVQLIDDTSATVPFPSMPSVDAVLIASQFVDDGLSREAVRKIIAFSVCGGAALVVILVVSLVYGCYVHKRPREVLNPTGVDTVVYGSVAVMSPLGVVLSALTVAVICSFIPVEVLPGSPAVFAALVMAGVMFFVTSVTYTGVLLRWFAVVLGCGVVSFLLGAGFLAIGVLSLVFYFDRDSEAFAHRMSALWQHLLSTSSGNDYVCNTVQDTLQCSGFHAGCFITLSAECPRDCVTNNYNVNGCAVPFMYFMGAKYLTVAIVALLCGAWFVLLGTLAMTYYARFYQLPRNGRLRRTFRNAARPPMVPITYREVAEVRRMFALLPRPASAESIKGDAAVAFLETVFGEKLEESYRETVESCGQLTFERLMMLHFPFVLQLPHLWLAQTQGESASQPPPLPEPAGSRSGGEDGGAGAQPEQPAAPPLDMNRYASVAGALSPEELQRVLRRHAEDAALPTEEQLTEAIQRAALRSPSAPFCRGLSSSELAGLRAAWTALHPAISGTLTDEELRTFYEWSHADSSRLSSGGLRSWEALLDVTGAGNGIGWSEFCYPYAQKALQRSAEQFLKQSGCEVSPTDMVTRSVVADRYGSEVCASVFLPCEAEVSMARVVAYVLTRGSSTLSSRGSRLSLPQMAEAVEKTLHDTSSSSS